MNVFPGRLMQVIRQGVGVLGFIAMLNLLLVPVIFIVGLLQQIGDIFIQ